MGGREGGNPPLEMNERKGSWSVRVTTEETDNGRWMRKLPSYQLFFFLPFPFFLTQRLYFPLVHFFPSTYFVYWKGSIFKKKQIP